MPPERVAALRRAFDATLADPAFLDDAVRQNLEIGTRSGEELEQMVTDMLGTPPAMLEMVSHAIQISSAAAAKGLRPSAE